MAIGIKLTDDADGYNWPSVEVFEAWKFDMVLSKNRISRLCASSNRTRERITASAFNYAFKSGISLYLNPVVCPTCGDVLGDELGTERRDAVTKECFDCYWNRYASQVQDKMPCV